MPYGRPYSTLRSDRKSRYSRTSTAARSSRVAKARSGGNKAVAKTQKSRYVPKTVKNTSSIYTLARQVKSLQRAQIGQVQKNYERLEFGNHTVTWSEGQNFLFAMNDFTDESPLFGGKTDSTTFPGNNVPGYIVESQFQHHTPVFAGFGDYSYWKGANDDQANKDCYLPLSSEINMSFNANNLKSGYTVWIRVDIFKMKKVLLHSNVHRLSLPSNMQALGKMATDNLQNRNRFNKTYFNLIKTKWIKLHNNQETDMPVTGYFKHWQKFPEKVLKLDMDHHVETPVGNVDPKFITNVPQDDIYWCMLSCSNDQNTGNHITGTISRLNKYRDNEGVAT